MASKSIACKGLRVRVPPPAPTERRRIAPHPSHRPDLHHGRRAWARRCSVRGQGRDPRRAVGRETDGVSCPPLPAAVHSDGAGAPDGLLNGRGRGPRTRRRISGGEGEAEERDTTPPSRRRPSPHRERVLGTFSTPTRRGSIVLSGHIGLDARPQARSHGRGRLPFWILNCFISDSTSSTVTVVVIGRRGAALKRGRVRSFT
jgi:hypothetical protein